MPSDAEVKAGMEAITALTAEWQTKYGTTLPSLEAEAVAVLEAAEAVRAGSSPEEPAEGIVTIDGERWRVIDGALGLMPEGHAVAVLVPLSQEPPA